jgi:DDE superfamily endonuclease
VDKTTISRILKKRGIKIYKKRARNLVSKDQKATRKKLCARYRKKYHQEDISRFVFVDECYVKVGEYLNAQNERCYGGNFECIPDQKRFREMPKSPITAMIFGAVWRAGRSKLVVLPSGFKLNQQTYKDQCLIPLLKDVRKHIKQKDMILYQDKAPCHVAESVQSFLAEKTPCFIEKDQIALNSPDLNPLDYAIWSALKAELAKHNIVRNFEELKKLLIKEWNALPRSLIQESIDSWPKRCQRVEKSNGDQLE